MSSCGNQRMRVAAATPPHELSRDIYGFTVRPHHVKLYKQFAEIYKEEEAERSARWEDFLSAYGKPVEITSSEESTNIHSVCEGSSTQTDEKKDKTGPRKFQAWCDVRASLQPVEKAMQYHLKKGSKKETTASSIATAVANTHISEVSEDDSDEEFFDAERVDTLQDGSHVLPEIDDFEADNEGQESCPWREELDALVRGGVPMALRGEVWQVFVGSSACRVAGQYQALLTLLADHEHDGNGLEDLPSQKNPADSKLYNGVIPEKWMKQIEKDLPRTFPGHPALDANGRNALRRLLTAYARHNPNVGYCQAMNFFAGLLLLMMPEENAFWTLTSILDNCFEGYYAEKMIEFQVDQMVLEELVRLHFPRLMTHLDTLGLQVAWISGPWFLSIFVNILPWESVLRVWDVLFYEGNRCMLFRTTLALFELHGSEVLTAKDTGDALTMLQSLVSATFDSSQLVLTASVGYQMVRESHIQQLREKYRPKVEAMFSEQSMRRKSFGPISFSSRFLECDKTSDADAEPISKKSSGQSLSMQAAGVNGGADALLENCGSYASSVEIERACWSTDIAQDGFVDKRTMLANLISQISYMKLELSRALEDRRVASLRAEDLDTAFMELVKEDNRRLLSAKVETLESEAAYLRRALADKSEQDQAMIQVMVRMEHELKATQEARRLAEEDAETQRNSLKAIQVQYESVMASIKELESRASRAEKLLDATFQRQVLNSGVASTVAAEETSRWGWSRSTPK
ncbi:hypothetical protein GOP47_0025724 [Adiantum capillus-veneris]|uniref:Rab-GAP TBC domain-containing protein n=1 Tax=Adiantum capillus-veneris TaxID=13818 RepID=A0A9D4U117_ADICA|nr:hypothetical protein GOP47_0025724 [Adiantum capillus-veneris]